MTINELRKKLEMSQLQFAKYFGIPLRTVQKWDQGERQPAPYIITMMERILKAEGMPQKEEKPAKDKTDIEA